MANLTIKDIAKICNVGVSTVSRAINDDPGINKDTRERILKVIEEYQYVPNNSARNLKMNESNTIALLVKGIDNQFFQGMLKIFEPELRKLEYSFLLHPVGEYQDDASVAVELAKEKRLKGIIFLGGLIDYPEAKLKSMGIPYVLCAVAANMMAQKRKCSSVSIDDEKEGYKAVDYLCKMGHKKIAIICGRRFDQAVGALRLRGYRKALEDNGIEVNERLIRYMRDDIPEYSVDNGYEVTKELLASGEEFTALFAISDLTAFGAYKAIMEAGKKIPDDYSVMGFDGIELTQFYHPALTTMVQPCEEMIKTSIKMLMDEIDGKKQVEEHIFEAKLLERGSVKYIGD